MHGSQSVLHRQLLKQYCHRFEPQQRQFVPRSQSHWFPGRSWQALHVHELVQT